MATRGVAWSAADEACWQHPDAHTHTCSNFNMLVPRLFIHCTCLLCKRHHPPFVSLPLSLPELPGEAGATAQVVLLQRELAQAHAQLAASTERLAELQATQVGSDRQQQRCVFCLGGGVGEGGSEDERAGRQAGRGWWGAAERN